jgi:beta-glucosidase/6-phospho-beta-glucosidase/beta-galactosidase
VAARSRRILDEYVLTEHDRRWREDLRAIASLGVRHLRYGIPWYLVNPRPGEFDWSWTDQVLPYLVEDLRIAPILDLVHYGAPLWLEGTFLDRDYPARVAEYAAAVVERYGHLVHLWTPLNEPRVQARFSGQVGVWPPYRRGPTGYAQVLVALARGMAQTVDAIRAAQPDATIVHVDATACVTTDDPALAAEVEARLHQPFLAAELIEASVVPEHPMWSWLLDRGVPAPDLESLLERPRTIDIFGANFYPQASCWRIEGTPERPTRRRRRGTARDFADVLTACHERMDRPVFVTETSVNGGVRSRARWLDESVAAVRDVRAHGAPVIGYTWFPAFSLVTWSYRRGRRPLEAYLAHMGLWDLVHDESGRLELAVTGLEGSFAALVAGGTTAVDP